MSGPLTMLREAHTDLAAGRPLSPSTGSWFVSVLGRYLREAGEGVTLDRCAGLAPDVPHQRPWARDEVEGIRDAMVRSLASHYRRKSITGTAKAIEKEAREYQRRWLAIDKHLEEMPPQYDSSPEALFYELHRLPTVFLQWPLGWRRITDILNR